MRRKYGSFTGCILLLTLLLALALAGCGKGRLQIGLVVDLTGRASELGISCRNGVELAVEEINRDGGIYGKTLVMSIKDDKGLPDIAAEVDKQLIREGVEVVIGHLASGTGIAGLEILQEAGALLISPTMSTDSLTGKDDLFLRIIDTNRKQGELLAEAAWMRGKDRTIAMLYEVNNRAYSQEVCRYFKERYQSLGGQVVYEGGFTSGLDNDFGTIARTLVDTGADGMLIVAGGMDVGLLTQKIQALKADAGIYTGMWAMTGDLIENGGRSIEGVYIPGVFDQDDQSPAYLAFKEQYVSRYGIEPTFASVYGYETVKMTAEGLKQAPGMKADALKKALINIGTFHGLQGDFHLDANGDTDRGYYLFQVSNAAFLREK